MTPYGIEPTTFRLVTQVLNPLRHRVNFINVCLDVVYLLYAHRQYDKSSYSFTTYLRNDKYFMSMRLCNALQQ
jgi:hypothetical protein